MRIRTLKFQAYNQQWLQVGRWGAVWLAWHVAVLAFEPGAAALQLSHCGSSLLLAGRRRRCHGALQPKLTPQASCASITDTRPLHRPVPFRVNHINHVVTQLSTQQRIPLPLPIAGGPEPCAAVRRPARWRRPAQRRLPGPRQHRVRRRAGRGRRRGVSIRFNALVGSVPGLML